MPESKRSSDSSNDSTWATILAGGIGSRFWPVSTPTRPKQLLPLASDRPLIVDTVERARALVPDERIRILAGEHLAHPFRSVLADFPDEGYWIEPKARGTAPVLAWAAWRLVRNDPQAVMVSLHADHQIEPVQALRDTVFTAVEVARREDLLISIGAKPDRIETGFGHVEPGDRLATEGVAEAYRVLGFHEKPDAEAAAGFVAAGCLWNTGIFVWKAAVLLQEIERHAPELAAHLPLIDQSAQAFFDAAPVSVIDKAVMERSDRVATVVATFAWDDVGSWEALGRTQPADANGNVILGGGRAVDAARNIVFSDEGEVVLFGAQDLIVVRTREKTLVLPRERAADLKTLLADLHGDGG